MSTPITARAELGYPTEAVFDFLADLGNHVLLAPGSVELRSRDLGAADLPVRAVVRLRGPLAIRRTATTAIVHSTHPALIAGRARIGKRTRASILWTITPGRREHTSVSLRVIVDEAGFLDTVLLRLGGRGWLRRRFAVALACLGDQLAPEASASARTVASPRLRPALQPAS